MAEALPAPRRWRLGRILLATTVVLSVVVAIANVYILGSTAADVVETIAEAPRRPVAIVLGNQVFPGGHVSPDLHGRIETALELFRAGKVERIFLSGAVWPVRRYDEPAEMATWLVRHGVPREALILDREGYRTAATMANAARRDLRDVLICTQAYHLPRALYFARAAGLRATGVVPPNPLGTLGILRALLREIPARTEALIEVAVRGVRSD
jgi:SanA protein